MIAVTSGATNWLAAGVTDLRRGFDGLAALVRNQLLENPFDGQVFLFRGRRGDLKVLWHDGDGIVCQAPGTSALSVAAGREPDGGTDERAVVDAAGGHRLAPSGENRAIAAVGMITSRCSECPYNKAAKRSRRASQSSRISLRGQHPR